MHRVNTFPSWFCERVLRNIHVHQRMLLTHLHPFGIPPHASTCFHMLPHASMCLRLLHELSCLEWLRARVVGAINFAIRKTINLDGC